MLTIDDPFGNESETFQVGDLTVENREDEVAIWGSMSITPDKRGLQMARTLKTLMESIIAKIESA